MRDHRHILEPAHSRRRGFLRAGKYIALFMGVMVFIVCGTEHSVADMYYWSVSGVLYDAPGQSFLRLLVVSLGNIVGGLFLPTVEKWKARLEEKDNLKV